MKPPRRVMVPLDGSPLSQQALGIGAGIARREGAALHLVTVIVPLAALPTEAGVFAHDYTAEQALHDGFRRYLDEQADGVRRREPGVPVACSVLDGDVARTLAAYARSEDIDLVAATTHGWGGLKRVWLGSVCEALMHRLPCPLLLLRPSAAEPEFALHHILVALDRADDADAMLESALALGALTEGARYTLLQVVQLQPPLLLRFAGIPDRRARQWAGEIAGEAHCRLDMVAAGLRHRGIEAEARVLVERGAGEPIVRFARSSGCDLIVVGTRTKGLERAVFGSVADKVVRSASGMILAVPLAAPPARERLPSEAAPASVAAST